MKILKMKKIKKKKKKFVFHLPSSLLMNSSLISLPFSNFFVSTTLLFHQHRKISISLTSQNL